MYTRKPVCSIHEWFKLLDEIRVYVKLNILRIIAELLCVMQIVHAKMLYLKSVRVCARARAHKALHFA